MDVNATRTKEELAAWAQEQGFVAAFETSAKDDVSIDVASNTLVQTILERVQPVAHEEDPSTVRVGEGAGQKKDDECAC